MPNKPGNEDRTSSVSGSEQTRPRSNRGFASMDRGKQREIASKGGKAAHAKGTAHEFDSGEAREAGRKGGVAVSRNREHMAAIGRRGGEARGQARSRTGESRTPERFQNRPGGLESDREVSIGGHSDNGSADTNASRTSQPSGNERRAANQLDRNESFI